MGFGEYPAEYNAKVHGPYDPARWYGKGKCPISAIYSRFYCLVFDSLAPEVSLFCHFVYFPFQIFDKNAW